MRKLRVPPQLRMIDVLYLKLKKEPKPELRLRLRLTALNRVGCIIGSVKRGGQTAGV